MGVIRVATTENSRAEGGEDAPSAPGWLDRIRSKPAGRLTLRIVIGAVGAAMIIGGLIMVPFPGPGWLVVFGGLAVLATEFPWASRLLRFARREVRAGTDWLKRQNLLVRVVAGVLTLALAAAIVWASLKLTFGIDLIVKAQDLLR